MYFIGYDLGSSSIKAALIEANSGKAAGVVQSTESPGNFTLSKLKWVKDNETKDFVIELQLH
ncbi:MAG TPA: hypothetical protein VGA80_15115 [Flavobacteriaceae bacterium]|jgi:xylulokinase